MKMLFSLILKVLSALLLIASAVGFEFGSLGLLAAGLACYVVSEILLSPGIPSP